jgi:hypothetical protein
MCKNCAGLCADALEEAFVLRELPGLLDAEERDECGRENHLRESVKHGRHCL